MLTELSMPLGIACGVAIGACVGVALAWWFVIRDESEVNRE